VEGLGEVAEVRLKIKPNSYRNYGFVAFVAKEAAEKAVKELDRVRFNYVNEWMDWVGAEVATTKALHRTVPCPSPHVHPAPTPLFSLIIQTPTNRPTNKQRLVLHGRTLQVAATQAPSDKLRFSNVPPSWGVEEIGRSLSAQGCDFIHDIEVRSVASRSRAQVKQEEEEGESDAWVMDGGWRTDGVRVVCCALP
jgi:RNA recognition motif-containing protein